MLNWAKVGYGVCRFSPVNLPYRGMEEAGSEGVDSAWLVAANGRAMMKYMRIMISES